MQQQNPPYNIADSTLPMIEQARIDFSRMDLRFDDIWPSFVHQPNRAFAIGPTYLLMASVETVLDPWNDPRPAPTPYWFIAYARGAPPNLFTTFNDLGLDYCGYYRQLRGDRRFRFVPINRFMTRTTTTSHR